MRDPKATPPPANSARNSEYRDVIGNKEDDQNGDSIIAIAHIINEHIHTASQVYPTLANGVAVAGGVGAWALSVGFIQIVPINTIATDFDIHHISIENLDDNTVYELVLYAVEAEIGRVRFTKNANLDAVMNMPFQTAIIPANTQIQAKLASAAGNGVATISIFYHIYA